jgi:hypothetical protein
MVKQGYEKMLTAKLRQGNSPKNISKSCAGDREIYSVICWQGID